MPTPYLAEMDIMPKSTQNKSKITKQKTRRTQQPRCTVVTMDASLYDMISLPQVYNGVLPSFFDYLIKITIPGVPVAELAHNSKEL